MNIPGLTVLTLDTPDIKDFALERNKMLSSAKTDWALFLDSDEVLSPDLEQELKETLASKSAQYYSAYQIRRQDTFLNQVLRHGETGHAYFVRLAKRDWGHWEGVVHEKWQGSGLVGTLKNPIIHNPHSTLSVFVDKINNYSSLAAKERHMAGQHSSFFHITAYPLAKFVQNYFFRLGFLDGVPGLTHALMMSWHSYLTHTKNYLLWHQK